LIDAAALAPRAGCLIRKLGAAVATAGATDGLGVVSARPPRPPRPDLGPALS
jgi:hypothetical protein